MNLKLLRSLEGSYSNLTVVVDVKATQIMCMTHVIAKANEED